MTDKHQSLSDEHHNATNGNADPDDTALEFDPYDVDIGDALASSNSKFAIWFFVSDVDPDNERVEVYSGTMARTVWRWVGMDEFTVHNPNEDLETDEDRLEWLNTLPQAFHDPEDGERQELDYIITDDGEFELEDPE